MNRGGLLLVDDDPLAIRLSMAILAPLGVEMHAASTGEGAIAHVREHATRLVVLDLNLPDMSGLDVLESILALRSELVVIMLTGAADVATAVRALRKGAFDYLTKPVDQDELLLSAQRGLERERLLEEVHDLRDEVRAAFLAVKMGPSHQIARLIDRINQVASSSMSVLVLGETGAGKELVAQAIHKASSRHDQPFVAVDCGAIPETLLESELFGYEEGAFTGARRRQKGRFQQAEGGTLFLDEIGNLSPANQAKLLRVLEERKLRPLGGGQPVALDVRIVAATNEQLEQRVKANEFRQDLYYRLAEFTIRVPPLRARRDDLAYLAQRFREEAARELNKNVSSFDGEALLYLTQHDWPGNARELRNVVRQAVLACPGPTLTRAQINSLIPPPPPEETEETEATPEAPVAAAEPEAVKIRATDHHGKSLKQLTDEAIEAAERSALVETLAATKGNRAETARLLQIDAKTLYRKMKRYGL